MTRREAVTLKLRETEGPVEHSDLRAHVARDGVFVVAQSITLLEAGVAIAEDDVDLVGAWLNEGTLKKATLADQTAWEAQQIQHRAIVVQPFVLIRALSSEVS